MNLFKRKTTFFKKTTSRLWSFLVGLKNKLLKKKRFSHVNIDQKLVYDLSPKKIPSSQQLKHLRRFLNPREYLIIKICLILIAVNAIYLGVSFFKKHLEYSPIQGGEYIEGVIAYPKAINPLYAVNRDIDSDLSRLVYSSLFRYDGEGRLINDLVSEYSVNENKEYVIKIKEGVKWHNGESLTIDDVIFTIDAIKNDEYRSPLKNIFSGTELERIDDLTLKISLSSPYAPFLDNLTFGILPKNAWEKVIPGSAILSELNLKPIGSGPYKFKSLIKNKDGEIKEYNLIVNEEYYEKKPYIKNIKFKFFVNYTEAIKALNDNQIDGLSYLPFNERQELVAKDSFFFHELSRPQVFGLFFNYEKDKALSDKLTRVSLAQAIDKERLIEEVFDGVYISENGPILKNNYAYNSDVNQYVYNPAEAANNIKNRLASTSLTVVDSGRNVSVAEQIKKYWENIGVSVDLKVIPSEKAAEVVRGRDFEVILYGQEVGADPDVYAFWHSSQAKAGGLNIANYNNSDVDTLLTEGREIADVSERVIRYKKFQENIANNLPAIFLYSPTYTYVQSKKVQGFNATVIIEPSGRFASISDWYLKTKTKLVW